MENQNNKRTPDDSLKSSQKVQNRLDGRGQQDTSTKSKDGVSGRRACIHVHSIMLLLTMVRKLHSIALMFNLPLLHTGQMVLH